MQLTLIHERPVRHGPAEKLAANVELSESPFTLRFTRVVSESPQAYITRVRLRRAARPLGEHDASLGQVALKMGYESESSFSKAFKRHYRKPAVNFAERHTRTW